jgi:hypothetical protein
MMKRTEFSHIRLSPYELAKLERIARDSGRTRCAVLRFLLKRARLDMWLDVRLPDAGGTTLGDEDT